jgi:Outer membrane protein beta-barrel domain
LKTKIKFLLISILLGLSVSAQRIVVKNDPTHDDKPIHFGFSLGVNFMDYQIDQSQFALDNNYYTGIKEIEPGINIHAITNLRISEFFDLRCLPGISFGQRQLYFLDDNDSLLYNNTTYQMESSYLELPFTLKYKSKRYNNFRPYLIGGMNLRYDLAVKDKYDFKEQLIMIKPFDIYSEFGGGFDFYLTYFKFAIEFKYSVGMTNIFRTTDPAGETPSDFPQYTNMLDMLKSNIFIISFHFE